MIASRRRLAAEVNLGELGSSVQSLRVCLVRTPTLTNVDAVGQDAVPPIGLAYVAGALHAGGHKVTVVDAVGEALHQYSRADWSDGALLHGLQLDEIVRRIPQDTQVIGVSCMLSLEWLVARDVLERIRSGSMPTPNALT